MKSLKNPYRGTTLGAPALADVPFPSVNAAAVRELLGRCPAAGITPLVPAADIARHAGVASVHVKDERGRMGLGSFKALGAAYVIATDAVATGSSDLGKALQGVTYVTASAGNHGISVAAGAQIFGAGAVIYIAETVPESFAMRLREKGAQVRRVGVDYEASMAAAAQAAEAEGLRLLSDSSWEGYLEPPHRLMEGYLAMISEAVEQIPLPPTHIFLQAGVGGMAGAVAALARAEWGDGPTILVVEPEAAPALFASIDAGGPVLADGPVSTMGRLDCKEPSLIALKGLARDADFFVTISDAAVDEQLPVLEAAGLATSPSGGAGLAVLLAAGRGGDEAAADWGLDGTSRVLAILSEGPQE
ncbi:MAG: pyridoxal-phosphate dependent enzyme [Paracoccaceae bacterium]